ncbi:HAMP domain-containing protein [[Actinomadura] parvosata]|uniref:HAMP domain-containing protein n=1 Tax=[Actinomadura] parvosata TaxID=1955412 RepID=UPI00406C7EAE
MRRTVRLRLTALRRPVPDGRRRPRGAHLPPGQALPLPRPSGRPRLSVPEPQARRPDTLSRLLVNSLIALAVMAGAAAALGWVTAGRVLRPLGAMTATVRRITADRLDRRLAASGPDDELKGLANTFDELLDRLEAAFTARRRFVANASHESRTPLTLQRAMPEVELADPEADAQALRGVLEREVAAGKPQERLIEALLVTGSGWACRSWPPSSRPTTARWTSRPCRTPGSTSPSRSARHEPQFVSVSGLTRSA